MQSIKSLAFAMEHDDRTLMETCKEVIVGHFEDCPDSVPGLHETAFLKMLGRDDLNALGEGMVFRAIIRWYEAHQLKFDCRRWQAFRRLFLRK